MRTLRTTIPGGSGPALSARLDLPLRGHPRGYALFAHCFTCSKNLNAVIQVSRTLVHAGWAVLRFDFTGLGDSEGEFAETDFSSNVEDLVAAARWLEDTHRGPRLLIGHSLGGAAVLRAAAELDSVTAVATVGAPGHPEHVKRLLASDEEEIEREGKARVTLAGRTFTIRRDFLRDLEEQPMRQAIARLRRALLVMHAPRDETVGVDNAARIFDAAKHPKSFVSLDDADHLLTREEDAEFVGSVITAWAERYLPPVDAAPEHEDVVAWGPERGFRTELTVGPHVVVADEPPSLGGSDRGPTPYGYLLAGLGACTVMSLRMYADRKKWPLEQAVAQLSHEKVHARDVPGVAESAGKIDRIERKVHLRGPLSDEQRARLIEIADKCPVHRTLESPTVVVTSEERGDMPVAD